MKSVFGIEDKVRQEMYKSQNKRKSPVIGYIDGLGSRLGNDNKELLDKINSKKLP